MRMRSLLYTFTIADLCHQQLLLLVRGGEMQGCFVKFFCLDLVLHFKIYFTDRCVIKIIIFKTLYFQQLFKRMFFTDSISRRDGLI